MSACGYEHGLISIDEAIQYILSTPKTLATESILVKNSLSRYLSEAVYSPVNLPSFDQSAVDGYALCSQQTDSKDQVFQLIGEVRAGEESHLALSEGQAIRIFTGGKIPDGTSTVARQEIVKIMDDQNIQIVENLNIGVDIRREGEEVKYGQCLANVGQYMNIGSLAALSMAGVQRVSVYKQPKVAVVVTGDEVAQSQNSLSNAQVFDANGPLLKNWLKQYGMDAHVIHVEDQASAVTALFEGLKSEYDVIITTGGVSVGDYDFVRPCSFDVGFQQVFWKVKQKPGKPLYFAKYEKQQKNCYLLGLPGNPAAVYVCMQVYGKLLLDALQNKREQKSGFKAKITHDLKADHRERFLRMVATFNQSTLEVSALAKQQSHMLSNLMLTDCLVRIPASKQINAGEIVDGLFI
ncbi:molybdopterin molybdotransferase MoeA [Acinetobacter guerrae]|uniref:molybdopterin molybdotransferase MoeA n=1 Tax=Acinetobacter guerrae TaxID=1843371 RepID=UPI00128DA15D|nr:molybdopterin molybdotransferase MoeA [Acinetobacter guerrae]MPW42893.1 molybdopterin molybdenumtransferase MoeA [Acinetobacter guerrae]